MTAPEPRRTALFLCTGNSARSILAEFLLNHRAPTLFQAYSAGSNPRGEVHRLALRVLRVQFQIDPAGARSKSWEEYKDVRFDFVITLCDNTRESCPIWPGQPVVAHWGSADPAAVEGSEDRRAAAFSRVGNEIARRIDLFRALPIEKLDRLKLEALTRGIADRGESR
jgi:arsenate reductase